MTLARDFDRNDWLGFAGATPYFRDSAPLIRELSEICTATADFEGIWLYFAAPDDNFRGFYAGDEVAPRKPLARLILNALPEDMTPEKAVELGFTEA